MPIPFEVTIRKHLAANELFAWTNVYHVAGLDIAEAVAHADVLFLMETHLHTAAVEFHSTKISTPGAPGAFTVRPLTGFGDLITSGELLPKFIAYRVDYSAEIGRPGRKFYHALLGEGDQIDGNIHPTRLATIQGIIDAAAADYGTWLTDPRGLHLYTSGTAFAPLTQHQFKRKWARRGVPGP